MMSLAFHRRLLVNAALALVGAGWAVCSLGAPFGIQSSGNLRADVTGVWAQFSTVHGTAVPDFGAIPTADQSTSVLVLGLGQGVTVWNQPGLDMPGVLGLKSTPGALYFYPLQDSQGFGVTIEKLTAGPTTHTLDVFTGVGTYIGSTSVTVADGSVPTFIGFIDPDARIGIVVVNGASTSAFAVGNPSFQKRYVPITDPLYLPVAGSESVVVTPLKTYLHQGYANPRADAATLDGTTDNENVHDVKAWFPGLRTGDVLSFERSGSPYEGGGSPNHLLALLSSTEELLGGEEFRRVPGALNAGRDYPTPTASSGGVSTPTNIPQDFLVADRTFIEVPQSARYVMFTRVTPQASATPVSVTVSHIPRETFNAWVTALGLVGALANPQSDLDGDGLTLLEEFAFQKNPTQQDADARADYSFSPIVDASGTPGYLRLLFGARTDGPIRYGAEVSSDLSLWQRLPDSAIQPLLSRDGRALFSVFDPTSGPRRFGRLILEYLPP